MNDKTIKRTEDGKFAPGQTANPAGRTPGVPNKVTADIKQMVVEALKEAGGVNYLLTQAYLNPTAFMGLVGKVLPTQIIGDPDRPIHVEVKHKEMLDFESIRAQRQQASTPPVVIDVQPEQEQPACH